MEGYVVVEVADFSVDETIVSKEPDLGRHTGRKVVDMTEKENWTEDCALGDSRLHRDLIRPFNTTFILRWLRKVMSQVCSGLLTQLISSSYMLSAD